MHRNLLTGLWGAAVWAIAVSCYSPERTVQISNQQDSALWDAMVRKLQSDMSFDGSAEAAQFRVRHRIDSVLPSTSIYWGVYLSPRVSHHRITIVGISSPRRRYILETPSEWDAVRLLMGWRPATPDDAVRACVELITFTRPDRGPYFGAVALFEGERTLSTPAVIGEDKIKAFATPATATLTASGWMSHLTILERGKTVTFSCTIPKGPGAEYTATDSIMDAGFLP